mgnify:CR=1 FL=1
MKTIVTTSPDAAAETINSGGITAFPTETVYGLGADIFDEKAIANIFAAKRRPEDNPLIAHVGKLAQIDVLVKKIPAAAAKFIDEFFPGPLTLVLQKSDAVPFIATANLETIGVRMPQSELARTFLSKCNSPVVAPSANLSGKPSPTTWEAVFEDLNGRIDCILKGDATEIGLESTVVDCTGEIPLILRSGAVTLEQLRKVVPETMPYITKKDEKPRSPGLKHRHYAPRARVILIDSGEEVTKSRSAAYIGMRKPLKDFEFVEIYDSVESYARAVFDFFRKCDARGITEIYCETVEEKGIGHALMDRLKRASEG